MALFVIGSIYWQPLIGAEGAQNLWQLLLLLLVGAWLLEQYGRPGWAGLLLGLAGLLKVWPLLLVLGALARRQWRLALAGGLTMIVGTALALGLMGPGAYAVYLGPVRASETGAVPVNGNISLPGAVARLFTGDPALLAGPVIPGLRFDQAVLLGEIAGWFLLMGSLVFIAWCHQRRQSKALELLSQGLLVTIVLLTFPLTFYFGLIILLLPCALLIVALRQLPRPPRWWFGLLAVSLTLLLAPYTLAAFARWLLAQQQPDLAWLAMGVLALPAIGVLGFAGAQSYLLWRTTARRPI